MSDISDAGCRHQLHRVEQPRLVRRLDQARPDPRPGAEKAITDQMQEVMYNDPPWLFLYFQPDFYGVGSDVDWQPRRDEIIDATTAKPK